MTAAKPLWKKDVSDVWFIADFHLDHFHILRYCDRPFPNVQDMNRAILDRLNQRVKPNDTLYFLADFCMGTRERTVQFRTQIHFRRIFAVPGNHDKQVRKLTQEFHLLDDLAEVSVNSQRIVLCHYAMRVWHHSPRGPWHLYGHSHGRLPECLSRSMDVGVNTHDFCSWHFDEIQSRMAAKVIARTPAASHGALHGLERSGF
jgi:calcineurin-like phosphoesterase family protein